MPKTKADYLTETIQHLDIKAHDVSGLVEAMGKMAFSARDLHRAADIYRMMLQDKDCGIILCLAGSLFSAGLKRVIYDLVDNNMVDAIVSTGALIVDQDFFEGLGFRHYLGTKWVDDNVLRDLHIDRIYDTFIDEDELRICDDTIGRICDSLEKRPYSSREFIREMGRYLDTQGCKADDCIVHACYRKDVPIFVPAFSDCSAGFGFVMHQHKNRTDCVSIDSARDFLELTDIKLHNPTTGIFMVGGGVPKNFTQDIVVAADLLDASKADMHKYAIQITVADERDGALSGSTLKEASSWGKVSTTYEQMVYSEATLALPLIAGHAWHKGFHRGRAARAFQKLYRPEPVSAG
ncbi:MAG: deoxyhypusine synthase [Puniceicoccaceae bacterium]|nr:MAG: deoxyhypusine synthase [Puniceicoccaceae bacterium]